MTLVILACRQVPSSEFMVVSVQTGSTFTHGTPRVLFQASEPRVLFERSYFPVFDISRMGSVS